MVDGSVGVSVMGTEVVEASVVVGASVVIGASVVVASVVVASVVGIRVVGSTVVVGMTGRKPASLNCSSPSFNMSTLVLLNIIITCLLSTYQNCNLQLLFREKTIRKLDIECKFELSLFILNNQ